MRIIHCTRALRSQLRRCLVSSSVAVLSAAVPLASHAGPLIIEEVARITLPDPSYGMSQEMAIGGNSIIAHGFRFAQDIEEQEHAAFLFERDSLGTWAFVRKLAGFPLDPWPPNNTDFSIGMNSVLAAVMFRQIRVFERTAAGWVDVPATGSAENGDLEVHSGMIVAGTFGATCNDGLLFQKIAGTWAVTRGFDRVVTPGTDTCRNSGGDGGDVDLTGNRVIVADGGELEDASEVQIWNRNADGSWPGPPTAIVPLPGPRLVPPETHANGAFATIEGDDAIASSPSRLRGPHVLRRDGNWEVVGNLLRMDGQVFRAPKEVELLNGIAAVAFELASVPRDLSTPSIAIFRRNAASGSFEHVANLVSSIGFVGSKPEISGRRIVSGGEIFELPSDFSQPALIQDDFEDRNVAEWTPIPGSAVSVGTNGLSSFYRQSSVTGDAGGLRTGIDMRNQAIEADVLAKSFATGTGERWFGLTVRQTDPDNLYYVTLRNTNEVSLRKPVNGVITVLDSDPLSVRPNRRYKLRLEAIGSRIKAYVDGVLRVQTVDRSLRRGTPGLRMFKTAANYDNVVISPNPRTPIFFDNFRESPASHEQWWFPRLGTWTEVLDGSVVFAQTSIETDGRVTTDIDADDQVIQVRAKATQFAAGDRWFGLVSRLQDDQNFYYLTVRSSNSVSLRRFLNGQVAVLDTAEFPVSVGTWYNLRLEAIGNSLRGYVNGVPLVEARDNTFAEGTYGLATSRAAARFDDFVVTQP